MVDVGGGLGVSDTGYNVWMVCAWQWLAGRLADDGTSFSSVTAAQLLQHLVNSLSLLMLLSCTTSKLPLK